MSDAPKPCRLHPTAVLGVGPTNRDQCWDCEGRPPNWVCVTCRKHYPCEHNQEHPSLTRAEADAYSRVVRAHDAVVNEFGSREVFERALREFQKAVRTGYADKLAKASQN